MPSTKSLNPKPHKPKNKQRMKHQHKRAHKSKYTKANIPSAVSKRFSPALIASVVVTLILGGIPFGMGKYIELKSPDPFDSGAYVYSAKHLLDGAQMGVDEVPSAQPLTLLFNIIGVRLFGFSETGPKIIQMIMQIAALAFMFYTLRKIFGATAAAVSVIAAAIYLSAPLIAKFGNVKEQYMIALAICTACGFLLYQHTRKWGWLCICGFFAPLPFYCKPTGISIVIAVVGYLLISRGIRRQWKLLRNEGLLFLGGIIVGLAVPASLFIWQNRMDLFLHTFPVVALQLVIALLVIGAAFFYGIHYARKAHLISCFSQVRRFIWLWGLAVLLLALLISVIFVASANRYYSRTYDYRTVTAGQDVVAYLSDIPPITVLINIHQECTGAAIRLVSAAGIKGGYVENSWKAITFSKLAPQVFRYYRALCVPVLLALGALAAAIVQKIQFSAGNQHSSVWMLVIWWFVDMALVWVSPHSYEQYYLPLCASGAMLGAYTAWLWTRKLTETQQKIPYIFGGCVAIIILTIFTIPIFTGLRYSPDKGKELDYVKAYGYKRRGFAEALKRVKTEQISPWQQLGDYIRMRSTEQDTLYVWGWIPSIYVRAQRLAPVPSAFDSSMHTTSPEFLSGQITTIVRRMEQAPPKYIVDTRKIHFPNDRPPLELWPHTFSKDNRNGTPIPNNPAAIEQYDLLYKKLLAEKFDPTQKEYSSLPGLTSWLNMAPWTKAMPDEAQRYDAMKPLRDFVMTKYRIVGYFGSHILFERIDE